MIVCPRRRERFDECESSAWRPVKQQYTWGTAPPRPPDMRRKMVPVPSAGSPVTTLKIQTSPRARSKRQRAGQRPPREHRRRPRVTRRECRERTVARCYELERVYARRRPVRRGRSRVTVCTVHVMCNGGVTSGGHDPRLPSRSMRCCHRCPRGRGSTPAREGPNRSPGPTVGCTQAPRTEAAKASRVDGARNKVRLNNCGSCHVTVEDEELRGQGRPENRRR